MNKDELLKQKEVLQAELNKLEELIKQEEKPAYYIPIMNEKYFYIDNDGDVLNTTWDGMETDVYRQEFGNCYKTFDKAYNASNIQKDLVKLQRLALTLNKGERIDWGNKLQKKYFLMYDWEDEQISQFSALEIQGEHTYCVHPAFKDKAIKLFGKDRLKEILTYQRY